MPLFEVTNDPSSHPHLHKFLLHVSQYLFIIIIVSLKYLNIFFSIFKKISKIDLGLWLSGRWVETRTRDVQHEDATARELDVRGESALCLLHLLHVRQSAGAQQLQTRTQTQHVQLSAAFRRGWLTQPFGCRFHALRKHLAWSNTSKSIRILVLN